MTLPSDEGSEAVVPVMKLRSFLPVSFDLLAEVDPEFAASDEYREYLAQYPTPPRTWRDGFHELRLKVVRGVAWPLWHLGEGFEAAGYVIANAAAFLLRVNAHFEKERHEDDEWN